MSNNLEEEVKTLEIKTLELENFKGIKALKIVLDRQNTNIFGANATGKTTLVDAFRWLLFDKDSTDRSDFNLKTIDKNGNVLHGLEHTVTAELVIEDRVRKFSKTYKEKWQKKRGEAESTFTGHETTYSIDDVPMKKIEYQAEISKIVDEQIFKMITDPFYFADTIKWQERRNVLLAISGDVNDAEIIAKNKEFNELDLGDGIEHLRKSLDAKRKKLNSDIKSIPVRIDEANKSIREVNTKLLNEHLFDTEKELEDVEKALSKPYLPNPDIIAKTDRLKQLEEIIRDNITTFQVAHRIKVDEADNKLESMKDKVHEKEKVINSFSREQDQLNDTIVFYDHEVKRMRLLWDEKHAEVFTSTVNSSCPTCKRPFDAEVTAAKEKELLQNFNQSKVESLTKIQTDGKVAKSKLDTAKKELEQLKEEYQTVKKEAEELHTELAEQESLVEKLKHTPVEIPDSHSKMLEEKHRIELEIAELRGAETDDTNLRLAEKKEQLKIIIAEDKELLTIDKQNELQRERIKELLAEEKKLANEIAKIEKQQFLAEEFTRAKFQRLESKVNENFKHVTFKLFDEQVNGGISDVCEVLVEGVPFKDSNTGGKYNAGIDIINTLTTHYSIRAPLMIDNAEAVTELTPTKSQIIKFFVSPEDKVLRVA